MANYFQYFVPAFVVAVGFMDPGNWVTLIEGGSRFGYELAWVVCSATLLNLLLQTVSARLGVVTGKHFAQVCREELPPGVCILLWALCEMSIVTLDLTVVLGTAIGLNIVFRIPLLPSLFLMAVDSLICIAVLPLMEMKRAMHVTVAVVGIVLVCFLLNNVPTSTQTVSVVGGLLPKLRHETLYAAISIVGANVMPHNFYLHSALVKDQSRSGELPNALSQYCSLSALLAFGAVLAVNLAIFEASVAEFHDTGLVVLTLQDSQALIEQILNKSVCPALFGLALLCAGQLSTLNGSAAGQVVSEAFFDYQIHPWQHRILIRVISLVPVATCVFLYGNEGVYQMVMLSQVFLALHLPFTVAPLIKLTSSEPIMGSGKNSFFLETMAWLSVGVLGVVNVTLIFDLVFGDEQDGASFGGYEYLAGFDWSTEIWGEKLQSVVFAFICAGTTLSLGFLVWLIFTPLQSETQFTQLPTRPSWIEDYARQEEEALNARLSAHESFGDAVGAKCIVQGKESLQTCMNDLPLVAVTHDDSNMLSLRSEGVVGADPSSPAKIKDFSQRHVDSPDENHASSPSSSSVIGSPLSTPPRSTTCAVTAANALAIHQMLAGEDTETSTLKNAAAEADTEASAVKNAEAEADIEAFAVKKAEVEEDTEAFALKRAEAEEDTEAFALKRAEAEEDTESFALKRAEAEADADAELVGKDDDEMDVWGILEPGSVLADTREDRNINSYFSHLERSLDGPKSGRSDTSFGSEGGSGSGSLSRLSGLGRAARRQFALILDEFWATLFDLHGHPVVEHSQASCQAILDEGNNGQKPHSKQRIPYWKKQRNMNDLSHSTDADILLASTSSQLLQAHPQDDIYTTERRYLSMHMPAYHEDHDYQPATIHGYPSQSVPVTAGSLAATKKGRLMHLGAPLFRPQISPGHVHQANTSTNSIGPVSRDLFDSRTNSVEQVSRELFESRQPVVSVQWVTDNVDNGRELDTKLCEESHSTQCDKQLVESKSSSSNFSQRDPLVYRSRDSSIGRWDPLVYRATGELDISSGTGLPNEPNRWANFGHSPIGRGGGHIDHVESAPLVFDELSPSQLHRDAFSIQTPTSLPETHSLWSRQPFEQLFGSVDADGRDSLARTQVRSGSHVLQCSESDSTVAAGGESDVEVLEKLRLCLGRLLRLDGSDWLFRRDSGADEDLITAIATSRKTTEDAKASELQRLLGNQDQQLSERNSWSLPRRSSKDSTPSNRQRNATPYCGKDCVWDRSLLVSFGVWSVHRVLELSLMESRPELWGKYTYVLNRLQGILEPAFSKPRFVPVCCKCVSQGYLLDIRRPKTSLSKQGSIPDYGNAGNGDYGTPLTQSYAHPWPWGRYSSNGRGRVLSPTTCLDMIREVETAVGSRKGRTGTAAGDVAFPKGKENLASVLKRYKRRLSSKPPGVTGLINGGCKV